MQREDVQIASVEDLISRLEPVEQSEISSDIPANVSAELKRIKRNVSLVLGYMGTFQSLDGPEHAQLRQAVAEVRQECLAINATISKYLMLQALHLTRWSDDNASISDHYAAMSEAVRKVCQIAVPLRTQEVVQAL